MRQLSQPVLADSMLKKFTWFPVSQEKERRFVKNMMDIKKMDKFINTIL